MRLNGGTWKMEHSNTRTSLFAQNTPRQRDGLPGETFATARDDRTVRLWNVLTKREVARLEHRSGVFTVGFAPDGDALVSSALGGTIHRWLAPQFTEINATERRLAPRE